MKTDFEDFYINWYSRARAFAREYVISEPEAENIVQDVFLHLYERRILFEENIDLTAYFFTSIKNKCLDYLRKKVSEQEAIIEYKSELGLSLQIKYDSLDDLNIDFPDERSLDRLINSALETLPDRCRKIFIMSKLEGKKQKQIAEELHISINTVESQMAIAYKKLREELNDYLPFFMILFFNVFLDLYFITFRIRV